MNSALNFETLVNRKLMNFHVFDLFVRNTKKKILTLNSPILKNNIVKDKLFLTTHSPLENTGCSR